nr:hypothetical protein [Desulfobacula sp.]
MKNTEDCLNIFKLFPQQTLETILQVRFFFIINIIAAGFPSIENSVARATPPIEEIRTIIVQKCLWPPSFDSLKALTIDNLNDGLKTIDPYAQYISPPSLSIPSFQSLHLGVEIFFYKSALWMRTDTDGPADQAGVPEIVNLVAINQQQVNSVDLPQISALLDMAVRQKQVCVTVTDHPNKKKKTYKILPTNLPLRSFTWKRLNQTITIHIREFLSHDTAPKLAALYKTVVKAKSKVIIDLRGCTGGDLNEAIEIAGMFVSTGLPLATTHDRDGLLQTYRAPPGQKLPSPTWVIVDQRTASAAEILAAIIKYYRIAPLVGVPSAGKCLSQAIVPLSDGGDLLLTTLEIQFPDGTTCTGRGLDLDILYPDITVEKLTNIIKKMER